MSLDTQSIVLYTWNHQRVQFEGYFNYYAVPGSLNSLGLFRDRCFASRGKHSVGGVKRAGLGSPGALAEQWLPRPKKLSGREFRTEKWLQIKECVIQKSRPNDVYAEHIWCFVFPKELADEPQLSLRGFGRGEVFYPDPRFTLELPQNFFG